MNESEVIINEINKLATNNELLVTINEDVETKRKHYCFSLSFDEEQGFEQVETTFKVGTLNNVLKHCLNNGFVVSFETNYF